MSRLNFNDYAGRRPPQPAPSRTVEILLFATVGAICTLILIWPQG